MAPLTAPSTDAAVDVDALEGRDFERLLATTFGRLGSTVEPTEYYDRGADLIATHGAVRIAIQAKRHTGPIGERAVQPAHAARTFYRCDHGVVVANRHFVPRAIQLPAH